MPFLYHARPPDMRGEMLYPLNRLKAIHPDLYVHERAKYAGREALMELRIPILDVGWNDTLHLAPVHPYRLAAAWRAAGLSSPAWDRDFFRIPVERIRGRPCVWFASGALSANDSPRVAVTLSLPVNEVTPFDPSTYRELVQPPAIYHEYLSQHEQGRRPRPFGHIAHVLVAAPIDVTGLPLVRAEPAPA